MQVEEILSHDQFMDQQRKSSDGSNFHHGKAEDMKYPVYVKFNDGKTVGADFVISATGVKPSGHQFRKVSTGIRN